MRRRVILRFFNPAARFSLRYPFGFSHFILLFVARFKLVEHRFRVPFFRVIVFNIARIHIIQIHPPSNILALFHLGQYQAIAVGIRTVAMLHHQRIRRVFFDEQHPRRQFQVAFRAQRNGGRAFDGVLIHAVFFGWLGGGFFGLLAVITLLGSVRMLARRLLGIFFQLRLLRRIRLVVRLIRRHARCRRQRQQRTQNRASQFFLIKLIHPTILVHR